MDGWMDGWKKERKKKRKKEEKDKKKIKIIRLKKSSSVFGRLCYSIRQSDGTVIHTIIC
jgi:hypothetical protein